MDSKTIELFNRNSEAFFKKVTIESVKYTQREKEIALQLEDGNSHKMIADNLQISIHTVRTIVRNLYIKSEARSVTLFLKYMRNYPQYFKLENASTTLTIPDMSRKSA